MERIPFRSSANLMDEGIPPFTGDKEIEFRGNYETDGFIMLDKLNLYLLQFYRYTQG